MTTVLFKTLGCRLNQAESDSMAEQLSARGLVGAAEGEHPDVIVVNTCTVPREATKASRSAIRQAVRTHPQAKVVVVGCYAVSDPQDVAAIEGVDVVLGNDVKESFAEALSVEPSTGPLLQVGFRGGRRNAWSFEGPRDPQLTERRRVRANLKVQTGCDEWCTFCIIPTTRGPLRSLDEDGLIAQARALVATGAREVVLTGVHLGKYAFDSGGDERDLIRLLRRLVTVEGLQRLRLSSILSNHLTDELVDLISSEPRICPHLHVPLQSGDDKILEAMHRPYRAAGYLDRVERAAAAIPGLALATDVIVGFPGESDDAFEATMDVVRRVGFSKLHVFKYSARPGTAAATMADAVPPDVKKARSKSLIKLGNDLRSQFLAGHLGRRLQVLVEDERTIDGRAICSGQTEDYVRVWFEGRGLLGRIVEVVGDRVRADGLAGRR